MQGQPCDSRGVIQTALIGVLNFAMNKSYLCRQVAMRPNNNYYYTPITKKLGLDLEISGLTALISNLLVMPFPRESSISQVLGICQATALPITSLS